MIGYLKGKLLIKQPPRLMLDVQGVGYEVEASMTTFYALPEIGKDVSLFTHLVVRDDAHLLFGFANEQERHLFRTLIKINGVGAKMALTILSGMNVEQFKICIKDRDVAHLTRLPGVGKKTAERLIVEMRDRLDTFGAGPVAASAHETNINANNNPVNDAVSALISLGYKPQEASKYVHSVATDAMNSEEIIREALKTSVK